VTGRLHNAGTHKRRTSSSSVRQSSFFFAQLRSSTSSVDIQRWYSRNWSREP
jgi:hypothetical protein